MDLTVDNRLNNKTIANDEMNLFMKELSNALNKKQDNIFEATICNDIYNEIPLAHTYKNEIESLVDKYMVEMSYNRDFLYYEYDSKNNTYYFDFYSDGEKERIDIPEDEIKNMGNEAGTFWRIYDEEKVVEANYIKDSIKMNVESELELLEYFKNNKQRGNNEL